MVASTSISVSPTLKLTAHTPSRGDNPDIGQSSTQHQIPIPTIYITSPTPPRSTTATALPSSDPYPNTTPSKAPTSSMPISNPTYRLLHRGALSLPDSHLLLDGLTFAARLDITGRAGSSKAAGFNLLQNPLALALESMRGRPSLRFMGVIKLTDVWIDESGGVGVDIHPDATLTRIYFENIFCLSPHSLATSSTPPGRSECGIKVALGDSDGPETTEIIIYSRPLPLSRRTLQLHVARITPAPPPPSLLRLPRPDDPTPRKPPPSLGRPAKARELKRAGSSASLGQIIRLSNGNKRQKLATTSSSSVAASLGSGVRLGTQDGGGVFKIPVVPSRPSEGKAKGKGKLRDMEDVFGAVSCSADGGPTVVESKGKRKHTESQVVHDAVEKEEIEMEKANKTVIKQSTLYHLASGIGIAISSNMEVSTLRFTPVSKSHPEFKELFGWVYRGVGFALRTQMKTTPVDPAVVDSLVQAHIGMYSRPVLTRVDDAGGSNSDIRVDPNAIGCPG